MEGVRWADLTAAASPVRLDLCKELLLDCGLHAKGSVQKIYANANTFITKPATLSRLLEEIGKLTGTACNAMTQAICTRDCRGAAMSELVPRSTDSLHTDLRALFTSPRQRLGSAVNGELTRLY